jgi:hypothetical protein
MNINKIEFITTCFGEECRTPTMHLLQDLRNLNYKVYLHTNLLFNLDHLQFYNVEIISSDRPDWTCFEKFKGINYALKNSEKNYIYYLDCDSRFFDTRNVKYCTEKFSNVLDTKDFDIMLSWFLSPINRQLIEPDVDENKDIRNFKYGYPEFIYFLKNKIPDYEKNILLDSPLEGAMIFRKNTKTLEFTENMIEIQKILEDIEEKHNRKLKAQSSGFCMPLVAAINSLKLIKDPTVYHFFKPNFLREVFPFNWSINKEENLY